MTSSLSLFFANFPKDPFGTLDNLDLAYAGFQFNLLKNDEKLRAALFQIFFILPLLMWVLLGSDSTVDQVTALILNLPNFILGQVDFNFLISQYQKWYGLGTHWSASVIYSGLFIGISKHLRDKLDIKNSLNLSVTAGIVGLAIASFEFFWMGSYYVFQNQHWILSVGWPQVRIILQDALFGMTGLIVVSGLNYQRYKLNIDLKTVLFLIATVGFVLFWWTYGLFFPVQQLTVQIEGYGVWTSSKLFPQTMYTVPTKAWIAIGDLFYVPNTTIHLVNNLTKIFWTLTFYSLFKIKSKE